MKHSMTPRRRGITWTLGVALTLALAAWPALPTGQGRGQGPDLGVSDVTLDDLLQWTQDFRRWGQWGANDGLGAANFITDHKRLTASRLVRSGVSVSMSRDVVQGPPDNEFPQLPPVPLPPNRLIRTLTEFDPPFISDSYAYTGTYHGSTHSHVDSLGCHVMFQPPDLDEAVGWNAFSATDVQTAVGCPDAAGGIMAVREGIFTRAILLDIPAMEGVGTLPAGHGVSGADILAFEKFARVTIRSGDVVLLHTGRWDDPPSGGFAGFHASAIPLLYEREVAYIGSDGITDVTPVNIAGGAGTFILPVHQIVMPFLGINILDNLDLRAVAQMARDEKRWEFLITAGPLRIEDGMGSPLNPIATF